MNVKIYNIVPPIPETHGIFSLRNLINISWKKKKCFEEYVNDINNLSRGNRSVTWLKSGFPIKILNIVY